MSAKLKEAARRDDADFRARLAPLATEVLPPSATRLPGVTTFSRRRGVIVFGSIAASALLLGSLWAFQRTYVPGGAVTDLSLAGASPKRVTSEQTQTDAMIVLLLRRGGAALADGDIIAARLLYERAYGMGSATAATAAGKTYDVDFLLQSGAHGIRPDQTAAAEWFRKAAALGDPEARAWLARIDGQPRP